MDEKKLTYTAKRGEFKGSPTLTLTSGDNEKYPFTFGLQKAKRILACVKDIELFVAEEEFKAQQAQPKTVAVK